MIGDDDAVDTVLHRQACVFQSEDALQHQLHRGGVADAFHVLPVQGQGVRGDLERVLTEGSQEAPHAARGAGAVAAPALGVLSCPERISGTAEAV